MGKGAIVFDLGGPLRDSSVQVHTCHHWAAKRRGLRALERALGKADPFHTWQLFGLTQNFSKGRLAEVWEKARGGALPLGKGFCCLHVRLRCPLGC